MLFLLYLFIGIALVVGVFYAKETNLGDFEDEMGLETHEAIGLLAAVVFLWPLISAAVLYSLWKDRQDA